MMNQVTKEILEHPYRNPGLNKQVFIARRSRNRRIQNKAFTKLFYAFMEETNATIVAEVVEHKSRKVAVFKRIERTAQ